LRAAGEAEAQLKLEGDSGRSLAGDRGASLRQARALPKGPISRADAAPDHVDALTTSGFCASAGAHALCIDFGSAGRSAQPTTRRPQHIAHYLRSGPPRRSRLPNASAAGRRRRRPAETSASRCASSAPRRAADLFPTHHPRAPRRARHYYSLAVASRRFARTNDAVATLRKSIEVKPESDGFADSGRCVRASAIDDATQLHESWLRVEPDTHREHMLRRVQAAGTFRRAPAPSWPVFDGFSGALMNSWMTRLE